MFSPQNDIAGLETAKKLLKEAVVLPLWMPEFFQASTTHCTHNSGGSTATSASE